MQIFESTNNKNYLSQRKDHSSEIKIENNLKNVELESEYKLEEKEKLSNFWFVSHLSFEEYETKKNRLILNLRKWSLTDPKTVTVYIEHPLIISTNLFYDYNSFSVYLNKLKKNIDIVKQGKIFCFISYKERGKKEFLEKEFPEFEFIIDNVNSFVVNAEVSCDKKILDEFEKLGFQTKNINKLIRRQLKWMYRKVILSEEMEHNLLKVNELNELDSKLTDYVSEFYKKNSKYYDKTLASKITRTSNELRSFFLEGNKISDLKEITTLRKKYPIISKLLDSNSEFLRKIEELGLKIGALRFTTNLNLKSFDQNNEVIYNWNTKQFEIVLQSKKIDNPYLKGGTEPVGMLITEERIPYVCWKSLSTCFIDIEKPLWRTDEEKRIIQEISDLQAELLNKESSKDPLEIKEKINELTKKLILSNNELGKIDLLDEKYKEKISRVMIHLIKENGEVKRIYFKIRNKSYENDLNEINGFKVLYFDTEYELLNAVIKFLKTEKPYRIVGHVIPYDLTEIRDSARKNKTERFDIIVKKKEPRLWRRDFYQKVSSAAQEVIDTHRLASVWFPYLKLKPFQLSHKLSDVANFVYNLKRRMNLRTIMNEEFHKSATHEELRDLEILAINGNKEAEKKLDFYSTHDIDPLIEIFDFEPTLKLLYKAAAMVPHVNITDIAFTPTTINEIFYLREWSFRHTQLNYGYKQKRREDERQIFKKRLNEYMKRQLSDEGIPQIKPGIYYDTYLTYIPLELMLSSTFFPSQPEWDNYFKSLSDNPIIKIAELQYPKYFLRQNIHVDYYLYRKEIDTYREMLRVFNLSKNEATSIMDKYLLAVTGEKLSLQKLHFRSLSKDCLIKQYYSAYDTVKDKFRSFYISLKVKNKAASRRIKNYIRKESTRRESNQLSFEFFDYFEYENKDIVSLFNLPKDLEEELEDSSREKLNNFKSQYVRLEKIRNEIISILNASKYFDSSIKISKQNIVFMFNQYLRAEHMKNVFNMIYNIPPEGEISFRTLIDNAYKIIGEWIRKNNLYALGAKGDYLFIKEKDGKDIDFSNSPLIPIKKFDKLDLTKSDEEDFEFINYEINDQDDGAVEI